MNQTILETDDPNVKIVLKTSGSTVLNAIRQVTSTTGEEATGVGETTETVTIVRTLLTTLAEL